MSTGHEPKPGWGTRNGLLSLPPAGTPTQTSPLECLEIQERIHRYAWAFDERQRATLTKCFTEDAVWEGNLAGVAPVAPIRGREAIVEWLSGFWAHQHDQRRHLMLSILVLQDSEDSASAIASLALTAAEKRRIAIVLTSFYRFQLQRASGTWRIAHLLEGFDVDFRPAGDEQ